jgi:alkylhydroperoxidase family enzyme
MNRISGVEPRDAGLRVRIIYWLVKRRLKRLPKATKIRAHDPKLLELAGRMDLLTAAAKTLPAALKELVQLKVAMMVGCPF